MTTIEKLSPILVETPVDTTQQGPRQYATEYEPRDATTVSNAGPLDPNMEMTLFGGKVEFLTGSDSEMIIYPHGVGYTNVKVKKYAGRIVEPPANPMTRSQAPAHSAWAEVPVGRETGIFVANAGTNPSGVEWSPEAAVSVENMRGVPEDDARYTNKNSHRARKLSTKILANPTFGICCVLFQSGEGEPAEEGDQARVVKIIDRTGVWQRVLEYDIGQTIPSLAHV